jgi:hypothetical protein
MKHKVITTVQGKVVIDESAEIEEGCKYYDGINIGTAFKNNAGFYKDCDKIIATINHSIDLDVPMVIVQDEVEKLAYKVFPKDILETSKGCFDDINSADRNNWINGYKAAKEEEEDVYSEEDLRKYHNIMCLHGNIAGEEFIQSLNQEYIELEMETSYLDWKKGDKEKLSDTLQIRTDRVDGQLMAYIKSKR